MKTIFFEEINTAEFIFKLDSVFVCDKIKLSLDSMMITTTTEVAHRTTAAAAVAQQQINC